MPHRYLPGVNSNYDAIVVGSGPNGLAAAIKLAQAGRSVLVLEAEQTMGGGTRTEELTVPGFKHDVCSAIHSLAVSSPFLRTLPLAEYGLEWVYPPASVAHPLDDGTAVVLEGSVEETSENLGRDAAAYRKLIKPLVDNWDKLSVEILGPLQIPPHYPLLLGRFALNAFRSARSVADRVFEGERARALWAGLAGHAIQPLEQPLTAAFALMLGTSAHAVGWPMARGGSFTFTQALAGYLQSLGGEIVTGHRVESVEELPPHRAIFFDVTPRQLLGIAGDHLPSGYRRALKRYRYGPGVFKLDWALDGPIPWKAPECARAATIHLGGTFDEIAAAERAVWNGQHPERPYVLVVQPTRFDPTRAPAGKHTAWAYCHVPNGSTFDMTERIEAQIEHFAPGFRDLILARHVISPAEMEQRNANYVGGDINGGVQDLWQMWTRPTFRLVPYSIPVEGWYLCSSSTPPGGGVHGMCGYYAACAALKDWRL
jgi:phytoene dehydrogenase-like protein